MRLDPSGARDVDGELGDHAARAARQQHDAVAEPDGLAHVVGDEEDRQALLAPEALDLVVQQVAGHRVERAEGLVHEHDVGALGERSSQLDPLTHAAGQLVGELALEALEVVLIAATFDQDVSLVFLDDGVFSLVKGQKTSGLEMKNFSPMYRALDDYDVKKLYVERESMERRGLKASDLLVEVEVLDRKELGERMAQQDVLLSF